MLTTLPNGALMQLGYACADAFPLAHIVLGRHRMLRRRAARRRRGFRIAVTATGDSVSDDFNGAAGLVAFAANGGPKERRLCGNPQDRAPCQPSLLSLRAAPLWKLDRGRSAARR